MVQKARPEEAVTIMVPSLGESVSEATVSTWFKKVGDTVSQDEMLCELETDKVSIEVPSPAAGVITEIFAGDGVTVEAGATLGAIGGSASAVSSAPAAAVAAPAASGSKDIEHAPSAKKMMAEKGLDPSDVTGSGRDGRIMKEDVQNASAKSAPAPAMARSPVAADDAEREERVKMTRLRQTIARRLKEAQDTAAMLTTDIIYKKFVHMGVAVGTPNGLVVPVVRNADQMSFASIEKKISELGLRARDGKLSMAEMQGGTFTISNGGVYGSLMSSPILNPPQSGILGMHKIQDRPMAIGGQVVIRPMMYLALSYDHRIVDGKGAVTFLVRVKEALEDPRRLLMDL